MTIVEAAGSPGYNLEAKYRQFNAAYFGGELPAIPLKWGKLTTVGGRVNYRIEWPNGKPNPRLVRLGYRSEYHGAVVLMDSITLTLSNAFARTEEQFDGILLHEMTHVWFVSKNDLEGSNHGDAFKAKIAELTRRSGVNVPLVDEVDDLQLADKTAKPFTVVLLTKSNGEEWFMLLTNKAAEETVAWFQDRWNLYASRYKTATVYRVTTPIWTNVAAKVGVSRSAKAGRIIRFPEGLFTSNPEGDLKENGEVLATFGQSA